MFRDYYIDLLTFIKENADWKEKISQPPYCITVKQYPDEKYSELYMLSYDQIKSILRNPVVRACRGTVVAVKDNKDPYIACAPFFKFFNYGEDVDTVDWQTASVQEKVDGSLIKCFYFKDRWFWVTNNSWNIEMKLPASIVSSYSEPETDGAKTFSDLILYAILKNLHTATALELKEFNALPKNYTYMFELVSPKNRVVCDQPETNLVLLGVRDNTTHKEISISDTYKFKGLRLFKRVHLFDLKNMDEVLDVCKSYKDNLHEGFVICDSDFNRIKIKCDRYMELKGLKGNVGFTKDRLLQAILDDSIDDVIGVFPELQKEVNQLKEIYLGYADTVYKIFVDGSNVLKSLGKEYVDKKELKKVYAEYVRKQPKEYSKILFMVDKGWECIVDCILNKSDYNTMKNFK